MAMDSPRSSVNVMGPVARACAVINMEELRMDTSSIRRRPWRSLSSPNQTSSTPPSANEKNSTQRKSPRLKPHSARITGSA